MIFVVYLTLSLFPLPLAYGGNILNAEIYFQQEGMGREGNCGFGICTYIHTVRDE